MPGMGGFSVNGKNYVIATADRLGTRQRAYSERMRASTPFEATIETREWQLWGPIGRSRANWGEPLAIDYGRNVDHSYDWLLTSTPKRNAVTLTQVASPVYGVPISDITKPNWSEGAGDGDGSAFDELDEGIAGGTPDDATTYWTTTATGVANRLEVGLTSLTDPGVHTGHIMRLRYQVSDAAMNAAAALYQGTTQIITVSFGGDGTTNWQTGTHTLNESVAANITDYTALRVRTYINAGSGTLNVSAIELELPVPATIGGNCITIDEDRGSLFVQHGGASTQLNPVSMEEVQNVNHGSLVTDSVASWNGEGHVALGTADAIQRRSAVTGESATYANVTNDIEASKLARGPERLWLADPDDNKVYFTLGAISTANLSNAIEVVDPAVGELTGLYTLGEYMIAATQRGARSFTPAGAPAILSEALAQFPSSAHGASGATLFGWHYEATKLGLYAYRIFDGGVIENPVGPGEGLRGRAFEGPIDGYPTAVAAFKDSIVVSYLNPDGDSYAFRGIYGPETDATGRPDWYSFRYLPSLTCQAIGATGQRDIGATLILGEDDNIAYYDLGLRGREIDDPDYLFDTGGGTAFLTTLMLPLGARANLRYAKLFTENCVASTDTWTLAVQVDDSGTYTNVGSAITGNGLQTLRPAAINTIAAFSSIKPRLTQVASSETAPPQIRGTLALAFDVRPDMVREATVTLQNIGPADLGTLQALESDATLLPVTLGLPTEAGVNQARYGYIKDVTIVDGSNSNDMLISLTAVEWELT